MARNHASCMKGNVSSKELSLKCSDALDLGAQLYKEVVRIHRCASDLRGHDSVELGQAVTEQGSVLLHLANEIADGNDFGQIRDELAKRDLADLI